MDNDYLEKERFQIDQIDNEILSLIQKRFSLMPEIARLKAKNNTPIHQPERESKILEKKKLLSNELGLNAKFVEKLFKLVFEESKMIQEESLNHE